jgi:hypothetical protein
MTKINWIVDIPRYLELSVDKIYQEVKDQKDINQYLPDYTEKKKPTKEFLFNVILFNFHNLMCQDYQYGKDRSNDGLNKSCKTQSTGR